MKRLLFKETDLSSLPTPPAGYVYLGVSSTGEVSTVNTGGTVSSVAGSGGGAGLEGSQYVYVSANGTDTENATELQTAYDLAKTKKQVTETWINIGTGFYDVSGGGMFAFFDNPTTISWVSGQTYTIKLDGVEYTGVVDFGSELDVAMLSVTAPDGSYSTMEVLSQEIIPSRVIIAPGYYNFSSDFLVDEDYVSIVSLDGNKSVIFNGSGTINVTADNIFLKGIDVQDKNFTIDTNLGGLIVENCKGGNYSFGGDETSGSNPITVSGTFIDCEGGQYSFGSYGIASGYFNNCKSNAYSFGRSGDASGIFINCSDIDLEAARSFGQFGIVSGTFTNCVGGVQSFGAYGQCSGVFVNCTGGIHAFGGNTGTLTGKLYYCRLTSGTFKTVSGVGITRYCIDGNNATNNQG